MTAAVPFIVGAYASQPADWEGQAAYYDLLHETGWVQGLEVPFPGQMREQETRDKLGELMAGRFTQSIVTAIPGTMVSVWDNPKFGLGSPDEDGRQRALEFTRELAQAMADMTAKHGKLFDYVALHSAPTTISTPEAFSKSLQEVKEYDFGGARIVIEHCDEKSDTHEPEKGFLFVEDEIAIAQDLGLLVSLNWGRSAVGSRGDIAPNQHIAQVADSGVLGGVIFSGASPQATQYGPEWIDGHLPCSTDEPASLMTPEQITAGARLATRTHYLGAKCCVPKDASLDQRIAMLASIHSAAIA